MTRPGVRAFFAWTFAGVAVAAAIIGVRVAGGGSAIIQIEGLASGPTEGLSSLGGALPFGYAFAAGMLAAVNPCGIALLPGYLALYLGAGDRSARTRGARLARALAVAATMSATFVGSFGLVGVLIAAAGSKLTTGFPLVGLAIGIVLAGVGAHLLSGGSIYNSLGDRLAVRLAGRAGGGGLEAYAAYGLAYAAVSLGCALPIFLTVVGVASAGRDAAAGARQFLLYGLGMASVITALTLLAALFKTTAISWIRGAGARVLDRATGLLMVLIGAYVAAYWVTLGFQ